MQSNKPRYQPRGRFRLPSPKPMKQGSLFREYPYVFLLSFAVLVMLLAMAGGMSLYDSLVLGAWLGSIPFFVWQVARYLKYRSDPEAAAKEEAARKAEAEAKAKAAKVAAEKEAAKRAPAANPKIAVVPRTPATRVPIRKPGMNVKPPPPTDRTPKP